MPKVLVKCSWCKKPLKVYPALIQKFFCSRECFRKLRCKELKISHEEYCERYETGPKYERWRR